MTMGNPKDIKIPAPTTPKHSITGQPESNPRSLGRATEAAGVNPKTKPPTAKPEPGR
jgi:hypothetical protein